MTIKNQTGDSSGKYYESYQQQTTQQQPVVVTEYGGETDVLVGVNDADFAEPVYRDVLWAILFLAHLGVMIWLGVAYGSFGEEESDDANKNTTAWEQELEEDLDDDKAIHQLESFAEKVEAYVEVYPKRIFLYVVLPCAVLSTFLSYIGTAFVIPSCPTAIVQSALLGSVGLTAALMILMAISTGSWFVWLIAAGMIAIVLYYCKIVWRLIPFAAVNLKVSLRGISANWGMYIVAFVFSGIGLVWLFFWIYVAIGVLGHEELESHSDGILTADTGDDDDVYYDTQGDRPMQGLTIFGLLVSLYWTSTVLLNTIQVTVAGVMGTWCFDKDDASSCCSPAVVSSLYRSLTYSFGSICFGSLVQAIVTALRVMVENARNQQNQDNQGGGALLLCILDCILRCLEDIVEYFNQWAYVFVGIYGYSYLESGKKVYELFLARGWTAIITNSLVSYVLVFTSLVIAIISGFSAVAIDTMVTKRHTLVEGEISYVFGPLPAHEYEAFFVGLFIGIAISSVMMNVIKGAVNALIVCFADAPAKLEENHPQTVVELTETWSSVFPDIIIAPVV